VGYSSPLQALRRADEPWFGGKSANLGELLAAGIPVPPGFGLSTEAFAAFIGESGLGGEITGAVSRISSPSDVESIGAAAAAISQAMRFAPLPRAVAHEVECAYQALESETASAAPPVAVRSSAVGEDSEEATFAGQQETYLWVREPGPICDAVRDCWVSLYSPPAISYRAGLGRDLTQAEMAVMVQLMVDAAVSGVLFTCNPTSGDRSMVAINASWGLGLAVVGGEVTPDDYLVSKVTGEVVREHVHSKQVEYVPDADRRGAIRKEVDEERRDVPCLDEGAIQALLDTARRVERHFGSPQDVEWAIDRDGAVFVVQARPVTATPKRRHEPVAGDALSLVMKQFGAR
jgi:pyruvate,water dikinase